MLPSEFTILLVIHINSISCCIPTPRLFGKIAKDPNNHDEEILQAIRDNAVASERVAGQRMWSELQGILNSNYVNELVKTMLKLGLAQYIGK